MRDEFMSNATRTYIWALRINTTTAEDLETVFDFFFGRVRQSAERDDCEERMEA